MNLNKPKELLGLKQKVRGEVRMGLRTSDTGSIPTGRQGGPKVFVVNYAERSNLMPSPFWGRLTVRHAVGGMGGEDGRSEGHPVMGWIRVESLGLDITRPARELTSIGCFVARKLIEPILGGKANEATLCEPCALHRMGFGCQCVSQR